MHLGVNQVYDLPHHSIVFARDYKKNVEEIFKLNRSSDDISFYVRNASVTDSTLAPAGKSSLYILSRPESRRRRQLGRGPGSLSLHGFQGLRKPARDHRSRAEHRGGEKSTRRAPGIPNSIFSRVPPSISRTASARWPSCARGTASRSSATASSSVAGHMPGADFPRFLSQRVLLRILSRILSGFPTPKRESPHDQRSEAA